MGHYQPGLSTERRKHLTILYMFFVHQICLFIILQIKITN